MDSMSNNRGGHFIWRKFLPHQQKRQTFKGCQAGLILAISLLINLFWWKDKDEAI
jgi:hypothetical protein